MPVLANAAAGLGAGKWLDRRLIRVAAAALLAIELAVSAFMVAGTHGWIVPLAKPTGTDFVSFYAAGALANSGTPELVYNLAAHGAAEEAATEPGVPYQFFNYPPVFILVCAVLARLPYLVAFVLFEGATFGDMRRTPGPGVWINAADIYNRTAFVFGPAAFTALCSDLASYPLADAVAALPASSAGVKVSPSPI